MWGISPTIFVAAENCWWRWLNRHRSSWQRLSNVSCEVGSCHSINGHESRYLAGSSQPPRAAHDPLQSSTIAESKNATRASVLRPTRPPSATNGRELRQGDGLPRSACSHLAHARPSLHPLVLPAAYSAAASSFRRHLEGHETSLARCLSTPTEPAVRFGAPAGRAQP